MEIPDTDAVPAVVSPDGPVGNTAEQQLASAQATLKALELRLKPEHPDVQRMRRVVAELETKAKAQTGDVPVSATPRVSPLELARRKRLADVRVVDRAGRGEGHTSPTAVEQHHAEPSLEVGDLVADGRLGDGVEFRGLGEALVVHQVAEDLEVFDVHEGKGTLITKTNAISLQV